jgi:hypothetical protein
MEIIKLRNANLANAKAAMGRLIAVGIGLPWLHFHPYNHQSCDTYNNTTNARNKTT